MPSDVIDTETHLLAEFLLRAANRLSVQERRRFRIAETRWGTRRNTGTVVVARHRGVPTRCIDWSYSPLVALYFACNRSTADPGAVWWFARTEFDHCVGAQWPALYGKVKDVEDDIERDFIAGRDAEWMTALDYGLLPGDRMDRQRAWITIAGSLGVCHAEKIHVLGVRQKGRFVIPAALKSEAIAFLADVGVSAESFGLNDDEPADRVANELKLEFERRCCEFNACACQLEL